MLTYKSPLRYPGGKAFLSPYFKDLILRNGMVDGYYAEPYCGGSGLAIELLTNEIVRRIFLNDADLRIYAFWYSIFHDTEKFLKMLWDIPISIIEWKKQRNISAMQQDTDLLNLGFSTFYLNRCNRSGIISGGPIGGYSQNGKWKLDARFSKKDLAKRIEFLANYSNRVSLSNVDALVFLKALEKNQRSNKKLLTYLDPPYYSMGDRLYMNYYVPKDHKKLARNIRLSKLKWILSYDDVPEIRQLYRGLPMICYSLMYRANLLKKGNELIVFHPEIEFQVI